MQRRAQWDEYAESLQARAASWSPMLTLDELTPTTIQQVTAEYGIDFATALIFDRLCNAKPHATAIAQIDGATLGSEYVESSNCRCSTFPARLAIVPGAFYVEKPHTGADGRIIRDESERLGIPTEIIPTRSFGSLDENARIIRNWLIHRDVSSTLLVSLSKGSAEVKWAMREFGAEQVFRQLAGWINISGLTEGSPLVAWLLHRPLRSWLVRMLFWWRKYDFRVVRELGFGFDEPLSCEMSIPEGLPVIHVVGFPLQKHLSSGLMRRGHRRVEPYGPSDGAGILLLEAARRPGVVYPVWGVDHYLYPNEGDLRKLFRRLLDYIKRRRVTRDESVSAGARI